MSIEIALENTPLHECHLESGAKMGAFAGYDMPLYYKLGVLKEHLWTREHAGLFDVSHMGQAMIEGPGVWDLIERLTPSSYAKLGEGRTKYTVLTNEQGGIIDDLMVTKTGENSAHFVLNAGCKHKDMDWIKAHMSEGQNFTYFGDWALIALQGPSAERIIKDVLGLDLSGLAYMGLWAREDYKMFISRLGYTGEDGFELSVPGADAPALWRKLAAHSEVEPIGLAARDSLRLEMAYCLYGHDIDDTTSPIEADLGWIMGRGDNKGFIGADTVLKHREQGPARKRVGIVLTGKGVAREEAEIRNENDEMIGKLSSGGFSPSLEKAIGMGYVPAAYTAPGTKLLINVRGRNIEAEVAPMPFLAPKTKTAKKAA